MARQQLRSTKRWASSRTGSSQLRPICGACRTTPSSRSRPAWRARCLAQLGRLAEAEVAFDKAAAEAVAFRMPFWEMLVRSDLVVYVLDGAGRRDEQMAPLGRCIAAMVRPAAEYTELLGAGLDAEAAVAAFQAGSAACEPADARSS